MNHPGQQWLTKPLHLPFPFPLPLPSFAAACVAAALCCAILCIGMWLIPTRWPFSKMEPAFPGGSPIWLGLTTLFSLIVGVRAWKCVRLGDFVIACDWDLACFLLLVLGSRVKRQAMACARAALLPKNPSSSGAAHTREPIIPIKPKRKHNDAGSD